jgi:hypothetical protein
MVAARQRLQAREEESSTSQCLEWGVVRGFLELGVVSGVYSRSLECRGGWKMRRR